MSSKADVFLNKTLGDDFFESLEKFELWKPGTKSVLDHEEIKTALMIVPRTIMSLLIRELIPMAIGETKEVQIPLASNAMMRVSKHERDVYSGEIEQDNKKVVDFTLRSVPGVGLIIMSAFELYDMENIINAESPKQELAEDADVKVQKLIDERLALHDLIGKVVDKKIMEREAIQKLVLNKLTEMVEASRQAKTQEPVIAPIVHAEPIDLPKDVMHETPMEETKKSSPLKKFLDERKDKKLKKNEYFIQLTKSDTVSCPDCGQKIFDGSGLSACICYGDDHNKKIYLKKTEDGIKVSFGKRWDTDNIEMLLEILRGKNG